MVIASVTEGGLNVGKGQSSDFLIIKKKAYRFVTLHLYVTAHMGRN